MPPQNKRRPGFSRKAQYGLFAAFVITVTGALVGLLMVITARIDPRGSNAVRAAITDLTSPVSGAIRAVVRGVNIVIHDLLGEGVAASTRFDPQAKGLGEWARSRFVDIPEEFL